MLSPGDRQLFYELLRPPLGYRFDEAIGTTFSLDLVTLLTVPLAFTQFEWTDVNGMPASNPTLLLEAIRRNAERVTIFCQAGRASVPGRYGNLLTYLEQSVVEVVSPNEGGVFHPKVWLVRYTGPEEQARYRFVCLTRNLTGDRCWDLSLVIEGDLADREVGIGKNRPLGEFISSLPGLALRPAGKAVSTRARRMADEVRKVRFELPPEFDDYAFWPLGIPGAKKDPFPDQWYRALYVSPFVTEGFLDRYELGANDTLVSRRDELQKLSKADLEKFAKVYILSPDAEAEQAEEASAAEQPETTLTGLHAKLYVFDFGHRSTVLIGSANATTAAFGRNVEFLVELRGKKSKVGVEQILTRADGESCFRDFLAEYDRSAEVPPRDTVAEELEALADQARMTLASAGFSARVARQPDDLFTVGLEPAKRLSLPPGVTASAWPITVPEATNAKLLEGDRPEVQFVGMPLQTITSFYAFGVTARLGARACTIQFVLNLPLENAPEGRREAVLRSLLDDPEKFVRFLQFLLGGDGALLGDDDLSQDEGGAGFGPWRQQPFVVFEALLQALRSDPARLDQIASIVADLSATEDGRKSLPGGFLEIWAPIWAARQEIPG